MDPGDMADRFGDHHGGGWILITIGVIVVLVALGLAIWALVRTYRHHHGTHHHGPVPSNDPAVGELRMRFAKGEIDADEYERRAALLTPPPTSDKPEAT